MPSKQLARWLSMLCFIASAAVSAAEKPDQQRLLEENEYRSEIEEVVVVARQPEWRKPEAADQEWRPQRFELAPPEHSGRMEWLPEYTKDERDNYEGVRDRKNEKAEFKVFEWKF